MRILQLCNKPPLPAVDGGCKAMNQTTEMLLAKSNTVKVLSIYTFKHPIITSALTNKYIEQTNFEGIFVDTSIKFLDSIKYLNSKIPYNVIRFYSTAFEKKLIEILTKNIFDIIIFESIYMAVYLECVQKYSTAKCVLRSHNIEYKLWETRTIQEKNIFKKIYSKHLTTQLKKYETDVFIKIKNIISITDDDEININRMSSEFNTISIPFASNKYETCLEQKLKPTFYHLGAMDWQPNVDGLDWALKFIIPNIISENSEFDFNIAGRGMPKHFFDLQCKNIKVNENVDNAITFINSHDVLIAPIFSGGGMRVKIIEAMQLGKVVITTKLGAAGIPNFYKNEKCILIAETADEFIEQINNCLLNYAMRKSISENAKAIIEDQFSFGNISEKLNNYLQKLNT
jgi:glycosyltransferase involved in cell wall biosynthesis